MGAALFNMTGYNSMNTDAEKIALQALQLPPSMRAFIAEKLIESLDAESGDALSPEWSKEIRRRCDEIDRGDVEFRDIKTVFDKA